ncbi:MAG: response regulator [Deltaproteobacteria bacterium]|nr:response regulator [Deltaproteobacteria bacterium]MBW2305429.1 response regulator [Deltaproteobacteria bacterium]
MAKKILVVDDDDLVLIALTELLKPKDYEVTTALNGPEALGLLSRERFDLIILDIIMPEMSGLEVCRKVRDMEDYRDVPIIMLTAKSADEDREQGMEAGANLFLSKPISPQRLIQLVDEAVEGG